MLYAYYGDDITKVRMEALKKANELIVSGGDVSMITSEGASIELIRDALGTTSLFRPHEVFVLDMLSEEKELFDSICTLAPGLADSQNHFVMIEGPLLAGSKKVLEKHASEVFEYKKVKKETNPFALADALCARDKKTLWILLQEAWRDGKSNEELIGTLFWQLKMLRLAEVTKSGLEAGQKPFVYDKAKRALSKFKEGEVTKLSHELIMLYHDGHAGKRVIGDALEAWVLKL
jgi:DNA polymerase III delta subunit